MATKLTLDQFQRALPKSVKNRATPELVNAINGLMGDQQLRENFRDNLLSYTGVMTDGRFKIRDYVNAVRYVSYKLLGSSNIEAYTKTFPHRFQRLVDEGADDKTISSYCAAYNKTILVMKIFEQTMIPVHILNADIHQKAINVQATLMMTADSEKVRTDAANSLLTHLKPPEVKKMEIDINAGQDKTIDALRESTQALVDQQKAMLANGGMSVRELAHSKLQHPRTIIDGEVIPDDE